LLVVVKRGKDMLCAVQVNFERKWRNYLIFYRPQSSNGKATRPADVRWSTWTHTEGEAVTRGEALDLRKAEHVAMTEEWMKDLSGREIALLCREQEKLGQAEHVTQGPRSQRGPFLQMYRTPNVT